MNGLMEVSLVNLLPSFLHAIAILLCLYLLGNLLFIGFPWWLRNINHDGLIGAHDIRIIYHFRKVSLVIIFLSFQQ